MAEDKEKKKTDAQLIKELQAQLEEKDSKLDEVMTELTEKRSVLEPEGGPGEWCQAYKWHGGETFKNKKGKPYLIDGEKVSVCRSKYTQTYRFKGKKRVGAKKPDLQDLELCEKHAQVILGSDYEDYQLNDKGKTAAGVEKEGVLPKKK